MDEESIKRIPWVDILAITTSDNDWGNELFYNGVDMLHGAQETAAKKFLERQKIISAAVDAAISGGKPLYFEITAGAKAGTIMRLTNPDVFRRRDRHADYRNNRWSSHTVVGDPTTKPTLHHESSYSQGSGHFVIDGHYYVPRGKRMHFEVDEPEKVIHFERQESGNKTTKADLLIGYEGPTVWSTGRPVKRSMTLTDRYGREVGVGDVVLLGQSGNGRLVAGKITRISDARGVWVRHIGGKTDLHEKACSSDQIMLLKDIEQMLMMEKLKAL